MKKYNPVVYDQKKLAELTYQFDQAEMVINQKIYNSQQDEKNRIIRLKESKLIKGNLQEIAKIVQLTSLHDMHPDLKLENVCPGTFFLSSRLTDKTPVKILELNDEKISILWYGPEGTKFLKTLTMKQVTKNYVRIHYYDYVKGFKTIFGLNEVHFKRLYLAKQSLAFKIQMNKVMIELTNDEQQKAKLISKNEHYHKKMANKY